VHHVTHTYLDICNPKNEEPVCRVINVHMPSKSKNKVKSLVDFIKKNYKNNKTPVIFGGDSNVYYGGEELPDDCEEAFADTNGEFNRGDTVYRYNRGDTVYHYYKAEDGKPFAVSSLPKNAAEKKLFLKEHKITVTTTSDKPGWKDIRSVQKSLKAIQYKLVIANHLVRKRRPHNFFLNAQAAYKTDETTQESMFFAFPCSIEENGGTVDHTFTEVKEEERELILKRSVCSFAGAAHGEAKWKEIRKTNISCETYVTEYLLSDHGPVGFTLTVDGCDYRVLFANCAGLLHKKKGIVDNKTAFGKIRLADLHKWSNALVEPQIEGMIKLINQHKKILIHYGTWNRTLCQWDTKDQVAGFQNIIEHYYTNVKDTPAVADGEVDHAR